LSAADPSGPPPVARPAAQNFPACGGKIGKHGIGPAQVCLIILFDFDCQWSIVTFCLNNTPPF